MNTLISIVLKPNVSKVSSYLRALIFREIPYLGLELNLLSWLSGEHFDHCSSKVGTEYRHFQVKDESLVFNKGTVCFFFLDYFFQIWHTYPAITEFSICLQNFACTVSLNRDMRCEHYPIFYLSPISLSQCNTYLPRTYPMVHIDVNPTTWT